MTLEKELHLSKGIKVGAHEAILNIYYTAAIIKKQADVFFRGFGLTDVQFNVMMLLRYQSDSKGGLSQARLSRMMLVNRANVTSLIDRMEKAKMVVRTATSGDRRCNIIKLTEDGRKLVTKVEPLYIQRVQQITACLNEGEQKKLISMLGKIRMKLFAQDSAK